MIRNILFCSFLFPFSIMSMDKALDLVSLDSSVPNVVDNAHHKDVQVPGYLLKKPAKSLARVQDGLSKFGPQKTLVIIKAYAPESKQSNTKKKSRSNYENAFARGIALACYFADFDALSGLSMQEKTQAIKSQFPPFSHSLESKSNYEGPLLSEQQKFNRNLLAALFIAAGWQQGQYWTDFIYMRYSSLPKPLTISFKALQKRDKKQ